jgi:uroporphyrinogen decarboxylase
MMHYTERPEAGIAMGVAEGMHGSLAQRNELIDRFNARVDDAQLANPPTKAWVKAALKGQGAPRCPVRLKSLSLDVILAHGDALADLFVAYPDDIVSVPPYDASVSLRATSLDGSVDTVRLLTEDAQWTDEWGTRWAHAAGGVGATPVGVPLRDWSNLDAYLAHGIPDPLEAGRLDGALPALRLHGAAKYFDGKANLALFERLHCLHGMEQTLEDLYEAPREIERLLDALTEYFVGLIQAWASLPNVDAIYLTDDWGTQQALMIAPRMWRRFFAARYRRLCDEAHRRGLSIIFHSCGNIFEIIGDLIDAGVDVVNPLQPEALDLRRVAAEFGGKVAFWGGLSDQDVAVMTPAQVRDEVHRAIDTLGAPFGNRYVLCLSNIMMPEIPIENLVALFEACHDQ